MNRARGALVQHRGKWTLRYMHEGKQLRIGLGPADELSSDDARAVADERVYALTQARHVGAGRTLGDFLDIFERERATYVSAATIQSTAGQFRLLGAHFSGIPMCGIGRPEAQTFVGFLRTTGFSRPVAVATLHGYIKMLRRVWVAAEAHEWVASNPWKHVKLPRLADRPVFVPSPAQLEAVYAALPLRVADLLEFLAETGLRLGEARALVWRDVGGGMIHVRHTKTGRDRRFKTPDSAAAVLTRMRAGGSSAAARIFGDIGHNQTVRRWFRAACTASGIPRLRLHDLRHRAAHYLAQLGAHELYIAKMLGHRSLASTRRYTDHHPEAFANKAVDLLNAARRDRARRHG